MPAWTDQQLQAPHDTADKARRVEAMFANIAASYDRNNRLHSLWRDQAWRRTAVRMANLQPTDRVLDVACGTGDLSLQFAQALANEHAHGPPNQPRVLGADFTFEMLQHAQRKAGPQPGAIQYLQADALDLPLADASVDVVSIAFGIRNVTDPASALSEFYRVLRPGGRVVILEFSEPTNPVLRRLNHLYTARLMPHTASWIAGDRSGAYRYLPKSVSTFMSRDEMRNAMANAAFTDLSANPLTFGICVGYRGVKP